MKRKYLILASLVLVCASFSVRADDRAGKAFVSALESGRKKAASAAKNGRTANISYALAEAPAPTQSAPGGDAQVPLTKMNRLTLTLSKDLTLHRRIVKHDIYGPLVDKATWAVFFQDGRQIPERQLDFREGFCFFEKSPFFMGESEYEYEDFNKKHPEKTVVFRAFKDQPEVHAYGDDDADPEHADLFSWVKNGSRVDLDFGFPKKPEDEFDFRLNLMCIQRDAAPGAADIARITGNVFQVGQGAFPKGGMTEEQLKQKWNDLKNLFMGGHTPSEAELHLGAPWNCEVLSLERKNEDAPAELSYEREDGSILFRKGEWGPGTYSNGLTGIKPYAQGLIGDASGIVFTYRASSGGAVVYEIAETGKVSWSKEPQDPDFPDSAIGLGLKAMTYVRCVPK